MAYNRGYMGNPDALPAHAEPEQAAQILGSGRPPSSSNNYGNRPVPPPPAPVSNLRQDDRYSRPQPSPTYSQGPPPPQRYNQPPMQQQHSYSQPPPQNNYSQPPPQHNYSQPPPQHSYSQAPPPQSNYSQAPPPNHYSQAPPPRDNYASPPPPQSYGTGPRPAPPASRPTIPHSQRPPTVAPPSRPANDRDSLWPLFVAVDRDRTGQLSEESLRRALVNGDYTAFDTHTVKMMIRMFDTDRSGRINFDEFCGLWGFLAAWRGLFDRFDTDRSGNISYSEFSDALVAFGYRLSPDFVRLLFGTYARNVGGREKGLSFDLFVQACISLKRMTDVFKKYDDDRDGYITLSFEEFLTGAQSLFLFNSISPSTDTGLY